MKTGLERLQIGARSRYTVERGREIVAVGVGIPDHVLVGASCLPGHLVAACRLLHADRRPEMAGLIGELTGYNGRAAIAQLNRRSAAGFKEVVISLLHQAGRSECLDYRGGADHAIAVEILLKAGLERFQTDICARHRADGTREVISAVV